MEGDTSVPLLWMSLLHTPHSSCVIPQMLRPNSTENTAAGFSLRWLLVAVASLVAELRL